MKRILIVSFFYPPFNTIGAVRVGKLAKYLPEFGWEPVVLTVDSIGTLRQDLPVEQRLGMIVRTAYWDFRGLARNVVSNPSVRSAHASQGNKRVSLWRKVYHGVRKRLPLSDDRLIDFAAGWYRHAVRAGLRLIRDEHIDAIFSTSGPPTCHLIASRLARSTGKPWIADYRDMWSLNHTSRRSQPFQWLEERLERWALKPASMLVTVSDSLADDLRRLHGQIPVLVLPNGYDPEDYSSAPQAPSLRRCFTITYTGNINPESRNPAPVFQAIQRLKANGEITPETFSVRFFGSSLGPVADLAAQHGISDLVTTSGPVSFLESVKRQQESSVLLVLEWNHPSAAGVYTGKLFEYMGARRPVLATGVPGGAIDQLLAESGAGILANDPVRIEEIIRTWYREYLQNGEIGSWWHPNNELVNRYSRRGQAEALTEALNGLVR